jgi:hypothetical protein
MALAEDPALVLFSGRRLAALAPAGKAGVRAMLTAILPV